MHPLLDVSGLTDQQVIEKIGLMNSRIAAVKASGQSFSIADQLKLTIAGLQDELARRQEEKQPIESDPVAWDMDSYLESNINDIEDSKQKDIPRWQSKALDELSNDSDSPWGDHF